MPTLMAPVVENRYDIIFLFDIENGNPNGDPDMGNTPRVETDSGHIVMTDVCLKRKIRNAIFDILKPSTPGFDLYVRADRALQESRELALDNVDPSDPRLKTQEGRSKIMCETCVDIRMFGAALGISKSDDESDDGSKKPARSCNNITGPIQVGMARTFDPAPFQEHTITRMAQESTEKKEAKKNRQFGSKAVVPYALFGVKIFINPTRAKITGLTEEDLDIFKNALQIMFSNDMSSTRGFMSPRMCVAFKHELPYGNAHAHNLFDRLKVQKTVDGNPLSYNDYKVTLDEKNLPEGVEIEHWI